MKAFFKSLRWYNYLAILPLGLPYAGILALLGIDSNKGVYNVIGWGFAIFQIFCCGLIVRDCVRAIRESRRRVREFKAEMAKQGLTEEQRKELEKYITALHEIMEINNEILAGIGKKEVN